MFLYNVMCYFSLLCGGWGVSDSHVQAQILPVGARKGDEQVSRTFFLTNVKLRGLEDRWQVVQGVDQLSISIVFQCF